MGVAPCQLIQTRGLVRETFGWCRCCVCFSSSPLSHIYPLIPIQGGEDVTPVYGCDGGDGATTREGLFGQLHWLLPLLSDPWHHGCGLFPTGCNEDNVAVGVNTRMKGRKLKR